MSKTPRAARTFGNRRKHRSCPLCQPAKMLIVRKILDRESEQRSDTDQ